MSHDAERRATKFTNPNFLARTADATEQTESLEDQNLSNSSGDVQRIVLLFQFFINAQKENRRTGFIMAQVSCLCIQARA